MENLIESITELKEHFTVKMADFQSQITKAPASTTTDGLASEFTVFRSFIMMALGTLQRQVEMVVQHMDRMETYSRRKMLLLHGVPDSKSEDTATATVKAVTEHLQESESFCADDIARCHRMGRLGDKPRPILIKFKDLAVRNRIWFAKSKFKGSGRTLAEFLTKPRHDTFMAARQRLGVSRCWTRGGCIVVLGRDGKQHTIVSMAELDAICPAAADTPAPAPAPKAKAAVTDAASTSKARVKRVTRK